jgi:hypothetical protein
MLSQLPPSIPFHCRIDTPDELRRIVPTAELYRLDPAAIDFQRTYVKCVTVNSDFKIEPGVVYRVCDAHDSRRFTDQPQPDDTIEAKVIGHRIGLRAMPSPTPSGHGKRWRYLLCVVCMVCAQIIFGTTVALGATTSQPTAPLNQSVTKTP